MKNNKIENPPLKALIVSKEDENTDNLFVPILRDAIKAKGIDVESSTDKFWNSETKYDIIHFQWPEEVIGWTCNDLNMIQRLEERIVFFRSNGAHFIYTRHNIHPHYVNQIISRAYDIIEKQSDVVIHMGNYSFEEFKAKYPESKNVIILHHIYQDTYNEDIPQEVARSYLHLSQKAFIVTAFGKFRNSAERKMVIEAFYKWKKKNKLLLAPRLYPFSKLNNYSGQLLKLWLSRLGYYLFMPIFNKLFRICAGANDELIDNKDLPYYLAASDVIFIQRKDILNSGNVPLAFLFRKVVVGPNIGNIYELLHNTGNPTFDPNDKLSIVRALQEAEIKAALGQGKSNLSYALEHMSTDVVGKEYAQIYKNLANGK